MIGRTWASAALASPPPPQRTTRGRRGEQPRPDGTPTCPLRTVRAPSPASCRVVRLCVPSCSCCRAIWNCCCNITAHSFFERLTCDPCAPRAATDRVPGLRHVPSRPLPSDRQSGPRSARGSVRTGQGGRPRLGGRALAARNRRQQPRANAGRAMCVQDRTLSLIAAPMLVRGRSRAPAGPWCG